jgi:hypothetical protein
VDFSLFANAGGIWPSWAATYAAACISRPCRALASAAAAAVFGGPKCIRKAVKIDPNNIPVLLAHESGFADTPSGFARTATANCDFLSGENCAYRPFLFWVISP